MTFVQHQSRVSQVTFDSGAVAVTDATNFVEVARIPARGRDVALHADVGAGGALGNVAVSVTAVEGGPANELVTDTALDTPSQALWAKAASGSVIKTTAASGSFYLFLRAGAAEYIISAKKATGNTTVQVTGTIL